MPESNQHSELAEAILAMPSDHSWHWRDDSEVTRVSEHAPNCKRCIGEAALRSLEEQLEAAREEIEERKAFAKRAQEEFRKLGQELQALKNASSPAMRPES